MTDTKTAVDNATEAAQAAARKAYTASADYLKDTQDKALRSARGLVREQPLTAIGVAVAAGFLLHWALRQR